MDWPLMISSFPLEINISPPAIGCNQILPLSKLISSCFDFSFLIGQRNGNICETSTVIMFTIYITWSSIHLYSPTIPFFLSLVRLLHLICLSHLIFEEATKLFFLLYQTIFLGDWLSNRLPLSNLSTLPPLIRLYLQQ